MSELQSIMEAEQELREIFSNSKSRLHGGISGNGFYPGFCNERNLSLIDKGNLNYSQSDATTTTSQGSLGFSNYGHFRAPIKRPKCNPIAKDEKFKAMSFVNDGN